MSISNLYLEVPRMLNLGQRRSSEGYLNSNDLLTSDEPNFNKHRRGTNPNVFDGHFMDALRKNYAIASSLADLDHQTEDHAHKSENSMVRGGPQLRASSPRPLILQNHSKWRNDESSSISSADSALDELSVLTDSGRNLKWAWLRREAKNFINDVIDAFEPGTPGENSGPPEVEKLSAVQLRKDIKRFYTAVHPYLEVLSALYDIIMWKNPLSTLLLVLVIIYSLYRGWLASLILGLLIFQLSINYLKNVKNIDLGWMFIPRKSVTLPKFDISGAQLIFDIAKLAQKLLRVATNVLEKIESLMMWKNPSISRIFLILTVYWFSWSFIFSFGTCVGWTVLTIGIRIFFTTYLFERFPKLRKRFDTYGYFYRNLPLKSEAVVATTPRSQPPSHPTTARLEVTEERCHTPSSRSLCTFNGEKFESRLGSNFNLDQSAAVNLLLGPNHHPHQKAHSHYDSTSHLMDFDSPDSEVVVPEGTQGPVFSEPTVSKNSSLDEDPGSLCADPIIDNVIAFRSCVMNERERLWGITPGILYLTDAALVFRSRNQPDDKDQMMWLFPDLKLVKKTQSLRSMSLITGTRKSLEIHVEGRRKPVQFIGLAKRDDFVTRIQLMCRNAQADVDFVEQ